MEHWAENDLKGFIVYKNKKVCLAACVVASCREALLAEMGVAMREDGGTLGVFSPKKVHAAHRCYGTL